MFHVEQFKNTKDNCKIKKLTSCTINYRKMCLLTCIFEVVIIELSEFTIYHKREAEVRSRSWNCKPSDFNESVKEMALKER